jgi:hypothetical protein
VSFRNAGLPEESAFALCFTGKQIPRFTRDDSRSAFFRCL